SALSERERALPIVAYPRALALQDATAPALVEGSRALGGGPLEDDLPVGDGGLPRPRPALDVGRERPVGRDGDEDLHGLPDVGAGPAHAPQDAVPSAGRAGRAARLGRLRGRKGRRLRRHRGAPAAEGHRQDQTEARDQETPSTHRIASLPVAADPTPGSAARHIGPWSYPERCLVGFRRRTRRREYDQRPIAGATPCR